MKEITFRERYILSLTRRVWNDDIIHLAKCLNFEVIDNVILIDFRITAIKALVEFLKYSYPEMMTSPTYEVYKTELSREVKIRYDELMADFQSTCMSRVPYADAMRQYQGHGLFEMAYKRFNFLAYDMGLGKEQPLDAEIMTPNGTTTMGELSVGDKVFSSNGKPCNVIGIFPQGLKDVYKVHFSDKSVAECGLDHLWIVQHSNDPNVAKKWHVRPLSEFKDDLIVKNRTHNKYSIPKTQPVEFNNISELPLDPYLMGLMLGDGCFRATISYSTNDLDLIPVIEKLLPDGMGIKKQKGENYSWNIFPMGKRGSKNAMIEISKNIGLFNTYSHTKFIPDIYKFTSIENRLALMQGMLDSDGHFCKNKARLSMTTVSPFLAEGLKFIVSSLGGTATIGTSVRKGKRDCFFIQVILPNSVIPFRLQRRLDVYKSKQREHRRKITKVELIGQKECQCISVDSPDHSYLTNDFIVTHNTLTSVTLTRALSIPITYIICPVSIKWSFFRDLTENWGYNPMYFTMLDSKKSKRIYAFQERFVIINYDILPKFMDYLLSRSCGHIILDECHRIKNCSSLRFKQIEKLIKGQPNARVTFMSGTPIRNRVNDIFAPLKLSGHYLGGNYQSFLREFTHSAFNKHTKQVMVKGGKNMDRLFIAMSNFIIRRTKNEVLKELPEKTITKYIIKDAEYIEEYNKIIDEMMMNENSSGLSGSMHSLNRLVSMAKIRTSPGIFDLIDEITATGEKVVIFSFYKDCIEAIEERYRGRAVFIHGGVASSRRDAIIQKFKHDETCDIFIGQTDAAGEGIDLTCASHCIICDFPFTPPQLEQAESRLHRSRQKNAVNVYYCMAEGSIDEDLFEMIAEKACDISAVIDKDKTTFDYTNIEEELFKKLIKKR